MHESEPPQEGTLKIGAVSRLTGLSTHTLRKWQLRYEAVVPGRSAGGERVYTHADVERLSRIKRLVDAGVAPRDVARLELGKLTRRCEDLAAAEDMAGTDSRRPLRLAVIGSSVLAMLERQTPATDMLEIVARGASAADLAEDGGAIDLLVYECPGVGADTRRTVEQLLARVGAQAAVVVYRFAARGDLLALQAPRMATLRGPSDRRTLEQVALDLVRPARSRRAAGPAPMGGAHARKAGTREASAPGDVPAPRLSREAIARIAQVSPRMRCECPHHLTEILLSLRAFEDYSEACESASPEEAAFHHYLWHSAAQARALFEDAIEHVAEAEGINPQGDM